MAAPPVYPFEPKSNASLRPGQFWALPLKDGSFGCGRVVAVPRDDSDPFVAADRVGFLAGLMEWFGAEEPKAGDLSGARLVAQGFAHVKTIRETGGAILGCRPLELDGIRGMREISHRSGGPVYLYEGARRLRPATPDETATLPSLATWGYKSVYYLAEDLASALRRLGNIELAVAEVQRRATR